MAKHFSGLLKTCVCGVMLLTGVSCEKMNVGETVDGSQANVVLRIGSIEQIPFPAATRSGVLRDVCTKVNFLVYQGGERIRQENQTADDADFGQLQIRLSEGRYYLVVLAHSSDGNPTSTNAQKIGFTNSTGFTDTFLYADSLIVEDEDVDRTLALKRITAMVRFIPSDEIPELAERIRFYYTGGSGTFNATSDGWGVVNSKQSQWYDLTHQEEKFEIYTIPHGDSDELNTIITTYKGANDEIETERKVDGIPVLRNHITICRGYLFSPVSTMNIQITIDDRWEQDTISFPF